MKELNKTKKGLINSKQEEGKATCACGCACNSKTDTDSTGEDAFDSGWEANN
ncbi:hypothetical protein AN1V17_12120 [Vallitalea sediminicola]